MLHRRQWYSAPPPAKDAAADNPTLLVSWWCTGFALAIILLRLSGRYIRAERLFREDQVMALSILPLLARMALVHIVLLWGTNNAITTGFTPLDIQHREVGSKLVLASRIMYAAFLWIAKFTVSEFLKRLTSQVWKRSYQIGLQFIRWFLVVTFAAVVVATLAECQPFHKYWQVKPDPGPNCRQGHAQLITMGVSDVITDLLLVCFPIPIVLRSTMTLKRKSSLVLLFSLSLILVGITLYRVIGVIDRHSDQQFRSLLASLEILAAAAVSNAVVLGSFVRDRGEKKRHYRHESTTGHSSLDASNNQKRNRALTQRHWGSDADLVGDLGIRVARDLEDHRPSLPRPAPVALPSSAQAASITPQVQSKWGFPSRPSTETDEVDFKTPGQDPEKQLNPTERPAPIPTPRRMSFFDVGGLLEDEHPLAPGHPDVATVSPISIAHMSNGPAGSPSDSVYEPGPAQGSRRGSHTLTQDVRGSMSTSASTPLHQPETRNSSRPPSSSGDPPLSSIQVTDGSVSSQPEGSTEDQSMVFRDARGLLN